MIVSFSFPYRIPPEICAIPRYGAVNLHPTALPAYRGPNPLRVIYEGYPLLGATLHWTEEEFDTGRILAQRTASLPANVTPEAVMALWPPLIMGALAAGIAQAVAGDLAGLDAPEKLPRYYTFLVNINLLVHLPVFAYALIYHREIVTLIAGQKYVDSSWLLPLVTGFGALNVIGEPSSLVAQHAGEAAGDGLTHPGEVVLWLNPFSIGKGIEGFACEPATVATEASPTPKIHPLICQNTWRMAFDHQLDYAATPEAGRPLILERKRHHEGISGTRASHPPNVFYDPSSGNLDNRIQLAASRFQLAGIVYEIGAAFTGAVRLLFSKRDVFLPAGTRVVFQLEQKLRLVPAGDTPVQILPVKTVAQPPGS